jgi:hypothetical protein
LVIVAVVVVSNNGDQQIHQPSWLAPGEFCFVVVEANNNNHKDF